MLGELSHTYRYPFASELTEQPAGRQMRLATSGGATDYPYFFQGALTRPRLTALALHTISKGVAARFHTPPAMVARILRQSDPVVTCGGGLLRFEGFSACGSAYLRVDVEPGGYDGIVVAQGTTNVDFNASFRAALARVNDGERVGLAVGSDDLTLLRGADQIVERKVQLPARWLKGFAEVQAFQARMEPRAELNRIEAVRFLRSLPRSCDPRAHFWIVSTGAGLRASQREATGAVCVAGLARLRLLDELMPHADKVRVHADPLSGASEWILHCGPLRLHVALSPEPWRGFSGEGQILADLTRRDESLLPAVRARLRWQAEIHADELAGECGAAPADVRRALAALGSRGVVGFDAARGAYFHRELPFDYSLVEELHPRLTAARRLVANDKVGIIRRGTDGIEVEVAGTGVVHRVQLADGAERCTCAWHAKHQGSRGPCKHILAAQLATQETAAEETPV